MSILQGTIPDDWEGEYCRYAVCWPNSPQWLAVLRGVLVLPSRGRFWDEDTGNIKNAQSVIRETYDTNLHLQEVILSCNDENLRLIAEAIEKLAMAQCCGEGGFSGKGSGGSGTTAPPFTGTTNEDIARDPTEFGFDNAQEYRSDKCAIAHDILSTLERDMGEMLILNFLTIGRSGLIAVLAIALATPIPIDDIVAIAVLLLSIEAEIVIATTLDILNNNENDLICALYSGEASESSKANFLSLFNELADIGVLEPITNFAMKQFMSYMLGSDVVNRLYYKDLTRVWPEQSCICGEVWTIQTGVLVSGQLDEEFEVSSEEKTGGWSNAPHRQEINLLIPGDALPCQQTTISTVGWVDGGFGSNGHSWSYFDCAGTYQYGFGDPGLSLINICFGPGRILLLGAPGSEFTATVQVSSECGGQ